MVSGEEKVIGEANALQEVIIICGYGRMGRVLANEFIKIKQKFIVIDHNDDMFSHAKYQNILSIKGDATDSAFLTSIGINKRDERKQCPRCLFPTTLASVRSTFSLSAVSRPMLKPVSAKTS